MTLDKILWRIKCKYGNFKERIIWLKLKFGPDFYLEETAKAIFDSLAEGNFDSLAGQSKLRKPRWDIQPEHIKNIFRKKAIAHKNSSFKVMHHTGGQISWIVRGDGTLHTYQSMTNGHLRKRRP